MVSRMVLLISTKDISVSREAIQQGETDLTDVLVHGVEQVLRIVDFHYLFMLSDFFLDPCHAVGIGIIGIQFHLY